MMKIRDYKIGHVALLVEDNGDKFSLTTEAMKECLDRCRLEKISDGQAALAYLMKTEPYQNAPTPDLIFLDINLSKMSGLEVLSKIKSTPRLMTIPVIILTSSSSEEDVADSYGLHANCYIIKPHEIKDFKKIIKSIKEYWLNIVQLPPKND